MGKFGLQLKAVLDGVKEVKPADDSFGWNIKFKCSNCGELGEKYNRMELKEKTPVPGGRGEANLVIKCKLCSRINSVDLVPGSVHPYTQEDSEKFRTVLLLECRGVEPTDCFFGSGFTVFAESGTGFADVSLEEGEWVDYDTKSSASIGIYDLSHQFVRA